MFVSALCVAFPLAAQGQTVPAVMQGVEGGGGTSIPFGSNLACRYQCVYDKEELPWNGPFVISGMRIRPDYNGGQASPAKGFLQVTVLMSTTGREAATASSTFSENYGSDVTRVIDNRTIMLPAQPVATSAPRPANIDLLFDAPWVYGLTPFVVGMPEPDNLMVEIRIQSQPSGPYRVDNMSSCQSPTSTFGNVGPACAIPNQQPVELDGDASMLAGGNYTWRITNAPAGMPFMLAVNLTDQGTLAGVPGFALPYPMFDPADPTQPSQAMAVFGYSAPDCWFNIDPVVKFGGVCDASGQGSVSAVVPAGRQFVGTSYYTQAIVLAPTANPLFLISSLGRQTTVCGPLGVARIHQFYNGNQTPIPPPPASGTRALGVGLVLEFY